MVKNWNSTEVYKVKIESSILPLTCAPSIAIKGLAYIVLNIFYIFINMHAQTYLYISFLTWDRSYFGRRAYGISWWIQYGIQKKESRWLWGFCPENFIIKKNQVLSSVDKRAKRSLDAGINLHMRSTQRPRHVLCLQLHQQRRHSGSSFPLLILLPFTQQTQSKNPLDSKGITYL